MDFLRYRMATSNSAPTAIGIGYHFVGVPFHALMSFSANNNMKNDDVGGNRGDKRTVKRGAWTEIVAGGLVGRSRCVRPSLDASFPDGVDEGKGAVRAADPAASDDGGSGCGCCDDARGCLERL